MYHMIYRSPPSAAVNSLARALALGWVPDGRIRRRRLASPLPLLHACHPARLSPRVIALLHTSLTVPRHHRPRAAPRPRAAARHLQDYSPGY